MNFAVRSTLMIPVMTASLVAGSVCYLAANCPAEPIGKPLPAKPLATVPGIPHSAPGVYSQPVPAVASAPEKQLLVLFGPEHVRIVSPNARQAVLATDPVERPQLPGTMAAFCDDVRILPHEAGGAANGTDQPATTRVLFQGNCRVRAPGFHAAADKISYTDGWFMLEGNAELTTRPSESDEPHRVTAVKIKFHPDKLKFMHPAPAQAN